MTENSFQGCLRLFQFDSDMLDDGSEFCFLSSASDTTLEFMISKK